MGIAIKSDLTGRCGDSACRAAAVCTAHHIHTSNVVQPRSLVFQALTIRLEGKRGKVHLLTSSKENDCLTCRQRPLSLTPVSRVALTATAFPPVPDHVDCYLCCGSLHIVSPITMDPYYNQQPTPFHNWIIGVIVAIAIILLLIFFRVVRYRRRYVRVQVQRPVYPPTPGRVESGFNRDCKKAIQQSHACRCNDVYDPVTTDGPPPYTPGARPPTYPPRTYVRSDQYTDS